MMTFQTLKAKEKQDSIFNLFKANFYKGLRYQLLNPINFDAKNRYPVVLSLPSAGGKGTDNSKQIKDIPNWFFHGDIDSKYPYEKDVKVFEDMQKIGGNMKFTTWKRDKHGKHVALKMVTGSTNGTTQ
ncbi:hypothetical protein ACFQZF_07630 [Flavobacterium myungsuense]|uniref:Alpha/beta hydrolase n=1 Tax=Flavobacterium myungsuense TaxID=651823 RepID=A0ABW3IZC0_9FLAO